MPVTYEFQGMVLRLNFVGEYEPEDIIEAFLGALADPKSPKHVSLLADVTRSASIGKRSPEEIRAVAEFLGPHRAWIGGRCAVVADSPLPYGLSRMGGVYSGKVGVETQVFHDVESALHWLGVASNL